MNTKPKKKKFVSISFLECDVNQGKCDLLKIICISFDVAPLCFGIGREAWLCRDYIQPS